MTRKEIFLVELERATLAVECLSKVWEEQGIDNYPELFAQYPDAFSESLLEIAQQLRTWLEAATVVARTKEETL